MKEFSALIDLIRRANKSVPKLKAEPKLLRFFVGLLDIDRADLAPRRSVILTPAPYVNHLEIKWSCDALYRTPIDPTHAGLFKAKTGSACIAISKILDGPWRIHKRTGDSVTLMWDVTLSVEGDA